MMILIDGYNLLHSIQKTSEDLESITDVQLCNIISRYLVRIAEDGEIIFDGIGPPEKSAFDNINKLEVIFAGRTSDADSVIEDKIKTSTAPKKLTVVSSDRRIRRAARARKAVSVKSDVFWGRLCKQLARKNLPKEPAEKRHGLTESETEQWLELFDLNQ